MPRTAYASPEWSAHWEHASSADAGAGRRRSPVRTRDDPGLAWRAPNTRIVIGLYTPSSVAHLKDSSVPKPCEIVGGLPDGQLGPDPLGGGILRAPDHRSCAGMLAEVAPAGIGVVATVACAEPSRFHGRSTPGGDAGVPSPGAGPGPAADAAGVLGISVPGADSSIPAVLPGIDMTGVLLAGAASAARVRPTTPRRPSAAAPHPPTCGHLRRPRIQHGEPRCGFCDSVADYGSRGQFPPTSPQGPQ